MCILCYKNNTYHSLQGRLYVFVPECFEDVIETTELLHVRWIDVQRHLLKCIDTLINYRKVPILLILATNAHPLILHNLWQFRKR